MYDAACNRQQAIYEQHAPRATCTPCNMHPVQHAPCATCNLCNMHPVQCTLCNMHPVQHAPCATCTLCNMHPVQHASCLVVVGVVPQRIDLVVVVQVIRRRRIGQRTLRLLLDLCSTCATSNMQHALNHCASRVLRLKPPPSARPNRRVRKGTPSTLNRRRLPSGGTGPKGSVGTRGVSSGTVQYLSTVRSHSTQVR